MSRSLLLGKKLHALRKRRELTLKELGDAAGLSASFISQIERGLTSPTVISLSKLAQALGVGSSYFLPPPIHNGPVVRKYTRQPFQIHDADVFYARLGSGFSGRTMEPILATYPPGFANERYTHPGEEFAFVLEGQIVFVVEGVEYVLSAGDSIHYSAEKPHHLENRSDGPAQIVYVTTPPFLVSESGEDEGAVSTEDRVAADD